jgi:hypothetical protein
LVALIKKAEVAVKSGFLSEKKKTDPGSRHARRLNNKTKFRKPSFQGEGHASTWSDRQSFKSSSAKALAFAKGGAK